MAGRQKIYDDDILDQALKKYILSHPDEQISYAKLERDSKIPANRFKYRRKEFIDDYNNKIREINLNPNKGSSLRIPSVDEFMDAFQNNPQEFKTEIAYLLSKLEDVEKYKDMENTIKKLNDIHKEEMDKLISENNDLKRKYEALEDEYNKMMVLYQYSDNKKEKQNIYSFTPKGINNYKNSLRNLIDDNDL
jgi:hypothetical protein